MPAVVKLAMDAKGISRDFDVEAWLKSKQTSIPKTTTKKDRIKLLLTTSSSAQVVFTISSLIRCS